ncbi:hypothetical protein L6164_014107 [Bauhinia variegata]|uniref:Uncharacterized protein n=1 Tax=Bauhinia variegata TaxID=167791 RepID=A0ACB9NHG2_BAUVA|nr:hypothetical protein L6164_014107 [Bauhinia variegata]
MPDMQKHFHAYLSFLCFPFLCIFLGKALMAKEIIPIGVVLDLNTSVGIMANSSMFIALQDFYRQNPHYKTRLDLRISDSENDVVKSASAALYFIEKRKVHAIIGPQSSEQARFIIQLGRKYSVPILSFSATSPSLSPNRSQIFIRTAQDDRSQTKAIADVVEAYGWREIILIYEDTEYGNGLIPYLDDALEAIDTRVRYRSVIDPRSNDRKSQISKELKNLKHKLTKIFLVHMTADLGSVFFPAAQEAGMMKAGYGWIVTQGLSASLDPTVPNIMDSMQGVIGVRPRVPHTERLEDFKRRWKSSVEVNSESPSVTLFGLWAYDTVWALAMAVERRQNVTNKTRVRPSLLNEILATNFSGLSGNFSLVNRQLEPPELEIFNLIGSTERTIGRWSPKSSQNKSKEKEKLKPPIWPGDTTEQPTKLRIGVPDKKGFNEFMKVERHSPNGITVSGFAIDVFLEVVKVLPFPLPYEFKPLEKNGTYDELLQQIHLKKFDAVVGDITIIANRTNYVDFTLPYTESGVSMVVPMKHDERGNMWIFLKPLSMSLWLTTGAAFGLTGFIIWLLEHRSNTEFRGSPEQQLGTMFWFSFSTLVFAHKEKVVNNWSRYKMVGPTYKTDGFGFAFPLKSPLVSYFSRAILNVTEDSDKFERIKNKYFSFSSRFTCEEDQSASITLDSPSLTVYSFAGLFVITGATSLLSLVCYLCCSFPYSQWPRFRSINPSQDRSFWLALTEMGKHFHQKDSSNSYPPNRNRSDSGVHPSTDEASFTCHADADADDAIVI